LLICPWSRNLEHLSQPPWGDAESAVEEGETHVLTDDLHRSTSEEKGLMQGTQITLHLSGHPCDLLWPPQWFMEVPAAAAGLLSVKFVRCLEFQRFDSLVQP
jgi:hypothetical protein